MADNMLFLHVTAVTLFLIFFVFKIFLLLINKTQILAQLRDKTRTVDIILGGLIFFSGIYLIILIGNTSFYILAKVVLVLVAIPLGIVGLKKNNKLLSI